jgi:hypothetical protein
MGIVALIGSIAILCWPILVMLIRALMEARRWRNWLMARAWISAWFTGSGVWIAATWIAAILVLRLITSTLFEDNANIGLLSWVMIVGAMVIMIPFAWRAPKEPPAT